MNTWVNPADVISRWVGGGAPTEASTTLATLIGDAEDEVLRHYPRIQERIDEGSLPLRRVQKVVSEAVIRAYKIAGDYRSSFSETTGPFSHSGSYGENTPRGVRLTNEEIAALAPVEDAVVTMVNMAPRARSPYTDYYDEGYYYHDDLYDGWTR